MKRLPSKTQRSKGFRAKHALQICLLLGVCFWLVYQVKHSHDKKKEFDYEKKVGSKVSVQKEDTLKLGRKDLPREEPEKKIIHEEEEEEEVEDDKHEEERENPSEEESRKEDPGNGDDELDDKRDPEEHEEDKRDAEENGEDERDHEENEEADQDRAIENEGSSKDQVVENSESSSESDDHEAREEHYRGDDASSEVAHGEEEPREASSLNGTKALENEVSENSTTSSNLASVVLEKKIEGEKDSEAKRSNDELPIAVTETRNSSALEVRDNSTEALDSSLQNQREDSTNMTVGESVKEQSLLVELTNNTETETEYTDESSKKESVDENGGSEEEEEGLNSSEKGDEGSGEESEEESGTHEVTTEHDPIDSTDTHEVMIGQEMNEALTDLDTLPNLKSHGDDSEEEVAAE